MLKVVLLGLFFGVRLICFSGEIQQNLQKWQCESLEFFTYGSANLLSQEPERALQDFQRAAVLLDQSDRSSLALSFLISFGQTIAYDVLGFREQCKQSIGSLFLAITEYDRENDQDSEISKKKDLRIANEYEEAVEFLRHLAAFSSSADVRDLLFSFVDEIAEELSPAFRFADAPYLGNADWEFNYKKDCIYISQCKSFWKKFKNWCRELVEFLGIVSDGYKKLKNIKDTYDDWNGKQNYQNQQLHRNEY